MVISIVMEPAPGPVREETTMWLIELNIAGRRFTHELADDRRQRLGWGGRGMPWRALHYRQSRAA